MLLSLQSLFGCRRVEGSLFEKLVYIGAISKYESSNVHLVAVTSAGDSFYFICVNGSNEKQ